LVILSIIGCDNGTNSSPSSEWDATKPGEWDATRPIVCIGDSQMSGYLSGADYPEKSWPAYLEDKVTVQVINVAKAGETTTGALARIESDVLSKNPQIVIIALGGNDFAAITGIDNFQTVSNAVRSNLQAIIDKVKDSNRKLYLANYLSKVFLDGLLDRFRVEYDEPTKTMFYNSLHNIYTSLAASNDIELIDEYLTAEICGSYLYDSVHPDETGIAMIADIIIDRLNPFLLQHNLVK
jgi:acyl-CoA thioesterase-1